MPRSQLILSDASTTIVHVTRRGESPGRRSIALFLLSAAAATFGCSGSTEGDSVADGNGGSGGAAGAIDAGESGGTGGSGGSSGYGGSGGVGGGGGAEPWPCPAGTEECAGACVDTQSDLDHCGACGNPCAAGEVCALGQCSTSCDPPLTVCGTQCVDTLSAPAHCGYCDNACAPGQACVNGQCSGGVSDPCAGITCNDHGWCEGGACLCDPGYGGAGCTVCSGSWQPTGTGSCAPTNNVDGTSMGELLDGTPADDMIRGLDGDDDVRGLDGSDYVNGNSGNDTLNGNSGRDEVRGGQGDDVVRGGADDDVVFGDLGNDQVFGDLGNDRLIGGEGSDVLNGGDGNDRYMIDGLGADTIDDPSGLDAARCVPGVKVVSKQTVGGDQVLTLSTGGSVRILGNRVEQILGCD